jgi:hypothetical protein
MKKNVTIVIILIATIVGGIFLYMQRHKTPLLDTAKQYERAGDLQTALSLYTETVCNLSPSQQLPVIYRSKFLTPDALKKEVKKYISWLSSPPASKNAVLSDAFSGMQRCMQYGRKDVTISDPITQQFTQENYLNAWNTTFFAPEAKTDPSHAALASGNLARNLSLVIIRCGKYYSYELILLNKATLRSTKCLLPSENSVRLYAFPGEHLLLVRSIAAFPSGEIWKSHFTPLSLVIPEKASEVRMELRTRVKRN